MVFNIILVLLIIIGIGLVVFACVGKKDSRKNKNVNDYLEANASVQLVKQAIDDADNAIEQLNKLSSDVFEEFEEKYQELLFLYQMIDDMKEKRAKVDVEASARVKNKNSYVDDGYDEFMNSVNKMKQEYKNPKYDKIQEMQKQGLSISEISKALNIGQGEIKLILELGKAR